ncbi:hypothetical protein TNCV_3956631 [Trichonephila clavipes]|nr:hypothetical protein TNCV_3956631 [Trichonephila clavipes]
MAPPAQCFRCQGFFHSSRFCTRNPKCVKCGKPHLTWDCKKKTSTRTQLAAIAGATTQQITPGCLMNPLNKPPPSQSQRLAGKRKEKKGRARSQKNPSTAASTTTVPNSSILSQPSLQLSHGDEDVTPTANASTPTPTTQLPSRFSLRNPQGAPDQVVELTTK